MQCSMPNCQNEATHSGRTTKYNLKICEFCSEDFKKTDDGGRLVRVTPIGSLADRYDEMTFQYERQNQPEMLRDKLFEFRRNNVRHMMAGNVSITMYFNDGSILKL